MSEILTNPGAQRMDRRQQLLDRRYKRDKYFGAHAVSFVGLKSLRALKRATASVDFESHGSWSRVSSVPLNVTHARLQRDMSKRKPSVKADFFSGASKRSVTFILRFYVSLWYFGSCYSTTSHPARRTKIWTSFITFQVFAEGTSSAFQKHLHRNHPILLYHLKDSMK